MRSKTSSLVSSLCRKKLILSVVILAALLLCAPTVRHEAPAAEIIPIPPEANSEGPRVQLRREEAPSETGEGHPGGTGSRPEIASGDQPEISNSAEVRAIWEDVPLSAELQAALLAICEEHGVDPLLALGLIETESNFRADIVSATGDYGLCQLNHLYFPTDLTPEENLRAGIGHLGRLLAAYGDPAAALTAYNRGHDDGTRSYARVVLGHAAAWGYGA